MSDIDVGQENLADITSGAAARATAKMCNVELVSQHSNARCTLGKSFGCADAATIWVAKCRGTFRCGASGTTFPCGYPPGEDSYTCACTDRYEPRARTARCDRAQSQQPVVWERTPPAAVHRLESHFTADAAQYQALHPETPAAIAAERALICGRVWNAHEQQRSSEACTVQRSFSLRVSGAASRGAWCAALVRRHANRTVALVGDSMLRQQFHQLACSCREFVDVERTPPTARYWRCQNSACLNSRGQFELFDPATGARASLKYVFIPAHNAENVDVGLQWLQPSLWRADALVLGVGAWLQSGYPDRDKWRSTLKEVEIHPAGTATPAGSTGWSTLRATLRRRQASGGGGEEWHGVRAGRARGGGRQRRHSRGQRVGGVRGGGGADLARRGALQPRHLDHPGSLAIDREVVFENMPFAVMMDCRHYCFPGATARGAECVLGGCLRRANSLHLRDACVRVRGGLSLRDYRRAVTCEKRLTPPRGGVG